jgi:hypothetical protein
MAEPSGKLIWNISELSVALKISPEYVKEHFTEGRRISFMTERRIAREVLRGSLAKSEGAAYDLLDPQGRKWEVRSISKSGVYFCPSYMVGSGREFNENGFLEKLEEIEGYILCDIENFPNVLFWIIAGETVREWYDNNDLGAGTKISRDKALSLLKSISD